MFLLSITVTLIRSRTDSTFSRKRLHGRCDGVITVAVNSVASRNGSVSRLCVRACACVLRGHKLKIRFK